MEDEIKVIEKLGKAFSITCNLKGKIWACKTDTGKNFKTNAINLDSSVFRREGVMNTMLIDENTIKLLLSDPDKMEIRKTKVNNMEQIDIR